MTETSESAASIIERWKSVTCDDDCTEYKVCQIRKYLEESSCPYKTPKAKEAV